MKFVAYFWLGMFIAIVVYLSFVNYMMMKHPNHFNGVPQHLIERYNEKYNRKE